MVVESLDHFTEYEPYCEVCGKEFNDVQGLKFDETNTKYCDINIHICSDCRKKLVEALETSL